MHGLDAISVVANTGSMARTVLILGFEGVQALDMVGPFEVFTGASLYLTAQGVGGGYAVRIVSVDGAPVSTGTGLTLVADPLPDPSEPVDTVVLPGGFGTDAARRDRELIDWISTAARHARRVVSVCTGAVLAAQAGLLDGCVATTHWAFAPQMAAEFPLVTVDPDPIFVRSSQRCGPPRGSPRASTWRWRWWRTITAPRPRRPSPATWSCTCDARAGRPSSPHRCGCPVPAGRR